MRLFKQTIPLQRLLSVALYLSFVCAQLIALEHELEHDGHEHEHHASCEAFAAYSAVSVACDSNPFSSLLVNKFIPILDSAYHIVVIDIPHFSFIRAPPNNTSV